MGKVEVVYFADGLGNLIEYCDQGYWGLLLGQGRWWASIVSGMDGGGGGLISSRFEDPVFLLNILHLAGDQDSALLSTSPQHRSSSLWWWNQFPPNMVFTHSFRVVSKISYDKLKKFHININSFNIRKTSVDRLWWFFFHDYFYFFIETQKSQNCDKRVQIHSLNKMHIGIWILTC